MKTLLYLAGMLALTGLTLAACGQAAQPSPGTGSKAPTANSTGLAANANTNASIGVA